MSILIHFTVLIFYLYILAPHIRSSPDAKLNHQMRKIKKCFFKFARFICIYASVYKRLYKEKTTQRWPCSRRYYMSLRQVKQMIKRGKKQLHSYIDFLHKRSTYKKRAAHWNNAPPLFLFLRKVVDFAIVCY